MATIIVKNAPLLQEERYLVEAMEEIVGKGEVQSCSLFSSSKSDSNASFLVRINTRESALSLNQLSEAGLLEFWSCSLTIQFVQDDDEAESDSSCFGDSSKQKDKVMPASVCSYEILKKSIDDQSSTKIHQPPDFVPCSHPSQQYTISTDFKRSEKAFSLDDSKSKEKSVLNVENLLAFDSELSYLEASSKQKELMTTSLCSCEASEKSKDDKSNTRICKPPDFVPCHPSQQSTISTDVKRSEKAFSSKNSKPKEESVFNAENVLAFDGGFSYFEASSKQNDVMMASVCSSEMTKKSTGDQSKTRMLQPSDSVPGEPNLISTDCKRSEKAFLPKNSKSKGELVFSVENVHGFDSDFSSFEVSSKQKDVVLPASICHSEMMKKSEDDRSNIRIHRPRDAVEIIQKYLEAKGSVREHRYSQNLPQNIQASKSSLIPYSREKGLVCRADNGAELKNMLKCTLHMCCPIAEYTFCVLHSTTEVLVDLETNSRKICMYLQDNSVEYKLELSYTDIRYVIGDQLKDSENKIALLRLRHAPRVYYRIYDYFNRKLKQRRENVYEWVRTTDYAGSGSIAKSSLFGLEISKLVDTTFLKEKFVHYRKSEQDIALEFCKQFTPNTKNLAILNPPEGCDVPFSVIFKLNALLQCGTISWPTLDNKFFDFLHSQRNSVAKLKKAFTKLECNAENIVHKPFDWLGEKLKAAENSNENGDTDDKPLAKGLFYINKVDVTPSRIYFCRPEIQVSNRVLRHFAEHIENFLRVSFVDENRASLRSSDLSWNTGNRSTKKCTDIYQRILDVLQEGIVIGNKKFEFLAYSSSQLRESSLWMFASTGIVSADSIRKWMGNFWAIKNVAKCASRMGQSLSSSTETYDIQKNDFEFINDIELERNGKKYIFSDGIGRISVAFAEQVAKKCGFDGKIPSAFQIRYAGYKGVVAIDPTMTSHKLSLRNSMRKYTSCNNSLDVLSWAKYRPCYLNRQIIILLSTLGVKDSVFETLQEQAITSIDSALRDRNKAIEVLQSMYSGENQNILVDMLMCGYCPRSEPYLRMMLEEFRASKLLELKKRARIFVSNGRALMGCLDETRTLKYGEVFIQITHPSEKKKCYDDKYQGYLTVEGKVVVAKNPCLHPGDIRILIAVKSPKLQHMVDCIVFPQQGPRPHPNECSGSDLDGDIYFVSWDHKLIPPQDYQPMDYFSGPPKQLDHEVTMKEIQEHFVNHMVNDTLGIIANGHLIFADQEPDMAKSSKCLRLAELHSIAVDFPKTGIPAEVPQELFPKEYPDFMEKDDKKTYRSDRILGKLYRSVKGVATLDYNIRLDNKKDIYDTELIVCGFEGYVDEALKYKRMYDSGMYRLMKHYEANSEAEIISGNIRTLSNSNSSSKRKNGEIREESMKSVNSLMKEARGWFERSKIATKNRYPKASAWYHVSYHPDYRHEKSETNTSMESLISFPWVLHDILLEIKKKRLSRKDSNMS